MSRYKIKEYTYDKAAQIGVTVKPSKNKKFKIDIYINGGKDYLYSVGAAGYKDYPTYIEEAGLEYADERRRLFKLRNKISDNQQYSRKWFVDQLLW